MAPPPRLCINGAARKHPRMTACKSISSTRRHLSRSHCGKPGVPTAIPALLCRMSKRPKVDIAVSIMCRACSASVTSTRIAAARPPALSIIRTVSRAPASLRSAASTEAPSAARRTAVARPIPDPPPVMTAVLPLMSIFREHPNLNAESRRGGVEEPADDPYLVGEEQAEAETQQSRTDDEPLLQRSVEEASRGPRNGDEQRLVPGVPYGAI